MKTIFASTLRHDKPWLATYLQRRRRKRLGGETEPPEVPAARTVLGEDGEAILGEGGEEIRGEL